MKNSIRFGVAFASLALPLFLSACNPNDQDVVDGDQGHQFQQSEPHHIKYPAAVVYELGKGDPSSDSLTDRPQPLWRYYLCFERADSPVQKEITIDFTKLGQPILINWGGDDGHPPQATERLDRVNLRYRFTSDLADEAAPGSYLTADATFESDSNQSWQRVSQAPGFHIPRGWPSTKDFGIFDIKQNDIASDVFSYFTFTQKNVGYYVSRTFFRATLSDPASTRSIRACEHEDKPFFGQVGAAITPLYN